MKEIAPSMIRGITLTAVVLVFSSCSLFRDGEYASQWEIETEVPDSLQNGRASNGPAIPVIANAGSPDIRSNLVELADDTGATLEQVNLGAPSPMEDSGTITNIPAPGEFVAYEAAAPPVWPQTTASLPPPAQSEGLEGELPRGMAPTPGDLLLAEPPPALTDADLAAAPKALDGALAEATQIPADLLVPPVDPQLTPPGTASTAPGTPAAEPELPLLYGGVNLGDFYRDVQKIVESAAAAADGETPAPVQR